MHLPPPFVRPQLHSDPPALVRVVSREDILWNRPIFRAPPLKVQPPAFDATIFSLDLDRDQRTEG